jgi:hypothetical protein
MHSEVPFVGISYVAFNMSGICRKAIYPRILLLHLAQSRLFASLTLTYISFTSFDVSFNSLIYYLILSYGFAIDCGDRGRGEGKTCREGAMRFMVCMKACIIYLFDSMICMF